MSDKTWINIVYTGLIYQNKENPSLLFQAISELRKDGKIGEDYVCVDIYGDKMGWIDKEIAKYGLQGIVVQHGKVSKEEAILKQREARILWLMRWEDDKEDVIPGKSFEYMAARRPIMITGGHDDEITMILRETHLAVVCDSVEAIKQELLTI